MTDTPKPFDRAVQRRILEAAWEVYPELIIGPSHEVFGLASAHDLYRELYYLQEHGLLAFRYVEYSGGGQLRDLRLTYKGVDFLAEDGGLSAILGVVTVRLEADTIKALLVQAVADSSEDQTVKENLIRQIKAMPAEAVKVAAAEGLKAGLRYAPDAIAWLRSVLAAAIS